MKVGRVGSEPSGGIEPRAMIPVRYDVIWSGCWQFTIMISYGIEGWVVAGSVAKRGYCVLRGCGRLGLGVDSYWPGILAPLISC